MGWEVGEVGGVHLGSLLGDGCGGWLRDIDGVWDGGKFRFT